MHVAMYQQMYYSYMLVCIVRHVSAILKISSYSKQHEAIKFLSVSLWTIQEDS